MTHAKEAYYFSHDSNARHDPKILAMRSLYGGEGYGWYWMIIEILREQPSYKHPIEGKYWGNALAMQLQCDRNAIEKFVHDCINEFELFSSDKKHFWSDSLNKRMKLMEDRSKNAKKAAKARWSNSNNSNADAMQPHSERNADAMQPHSDGNATAMQIKESKVKEKKINNNYKGIYDYYLSLDLKNHRAYTNDIQKAIEKAMTQNKYDEDYCKLLLKRHEQVVKLTADKDYPVRPRPLTEFFGQKAYNSSHLICSEYEEGGKQYEMHLRDKAEQKEKPPLTMVFRDKA